MYRPDKPAPMTTASNAEDRAALVDISEDPLWTSGAGPRPCYRPRTQELLDRPYARSGGMWRPIARGSPRRRGPAAAVPVGVGRYQRLRVVPPARRRRGACYRIRVVPVSATEPGGR